jgi:hypothetical protein
MPAQRPQLSKWSGFSAIAEVFILLLLSGSKTSYAETPRKAICVELNEAHTAYKKDDVINALKLRLPDWTVREKNLEDRDRICNIERGCFYTARIVEDMNGKATIELLSCDEAILHLREDLENAELGEESLRRAAVAIAMAVDLEGNKTIRAGEEIEPTVHDQPDERRGIQRSRLYGSAALAPGLTLVPSAQQAEFGGFFHLGLLFPNGVWLEGGFKLSSRYEGTSEKGSKIGVADRAFQLGASYRLDWNEYWFVIAGLGVQYTHAVTEDLTDDKYKIEEDSEAARWSLDALAGIGLQVFRFFAVAIRIYPGISFQERVYLIRGSQALDLGLFGLDLTLGFEFFI